MSILDPTYADALDGDAALEFFAVEFEMSAGAVRLLDGSSEVTFAGRTFRGAHEAYGTLGSIDGLEESADAQVTEVTLTLLPPSNSAATTLASPDSQGGAVTIWRGAIDPASGLVIGTPKVEFVGELDVPTLTGDRGQRVLSFTATAKTELFFEQDESVRLSDAFWKTLHPDDPSFEYVTGLADQMPWGTEARLPGTVRSIISPQQAVADYEFF